ncbi:MAG: hypothetical protein HYR62_07535 [Actinobacteria bacterium]|nr:hypothetical protein [Actinomycetota bacterium]MBI3686169.1 hypothetical protein [Actinomycetota bacterium]
MSTRSRRPALRAAVDQLRISFFVGVALVPTLLTQLFEGFGRWLPWWGWSLVLSVVIAALFGWSVRLEQRRQRLLRGAAGEVRGVRRLDAITHLVLTVDVTKTEEQNLHTLLPVLTKVRHVYAVIGSPVGQPGDPELANERLAQLVAAATPRPVQGQVLHALPAFDVAPDSLHELRTKLAGLRQTLGEGQVLAVDITGGTVPMSLATYRAAEAAGVAVTYTSTPPPPATRAGTKTKRTFRALIALYDPHGELTGPSTALEVS